MYGIRKIQLHLKVALGLLFFFMIPYVLYLHIYYLLGNTYYYYLDPVSHFYNDYVNSVLLGKVLGKVPNDYTLIYFQSTFKGDSVGRTSVVISLNNIDEGIAYFRSRVKNDDSIKKKCIEEIVEDIETFIIPDFIIEECAGNEVYYVASDSKIWILNPNNIRFYFCD